MASDGRITILVSHRFSTVRMADLIVVLDGARVVEVGTHDELMAKRGRTPSSTAFRPRRIADVLRLERPRDADSASALQVARAYGWVRLRRFSYTSEE